VKRSEITNTVFIATIFSGPAYASQNSGLLIALSTDGENFQNIRNTTEPFFVPEGGMRDPMILGYQNHWFLVFTYGENIAPCIFFAESFDLLSWTTIGNLSLADLGSNNYIDVPQWIVGPAGDIHIIACIDRNHHWIEIHPKNPNPETWANPANWSPVMELTNVDGEPLVQGNSFVISHNDQYYMAFNEPEAKSYYLRTSRNLVSYWSTPRHLDIDSSINSGDSENLIVLPDGRLRYYISNGNFLKKVIWFVDSVDLGLTWTTPKPVSFSGFTQDGINWAPFICISDPKINAIIRSSHLY
jgi:hypothetical protein